MNCEYVRKITAQEIVIDILDNALAITEHRINQCDADVKRLTALVKKQICEIECEEQLMNEILFYAMLHMTTRDFLKLASKYWIE